MGRHLRAVLCLSAALRVAGRRALCITGAARTFAFPALYEAIRTHLVTPDTDVFAFLFESTPAYKDNNNVLCNGTLSLQSILATFNPVEARVHPLPVCPPDSAADCESCAASRNVVLQLGWVDHCFRRAEQHATAHGFEYDVYVRTRPDMFVGAPLPHHLLPGIVYTGRKMDAPGSDQFFAVHKETYASWWRNLCLRCSCLGSCCAEYTIFKNQRVVQLGELNAMLVRRQNRVECWDPPPRCGNETQKDEFLGAMAQDRLTECRTT